MTIEVLSISPTPGSTISSLAPVRFDVRTPVADPFLRLFVLVEYPGTGVVEAAYSGDPVTLAAGFTSLFAAESQAAVASDAGYDRFTFQVRRDPSWPASPHVLILAFSAAGLQSVDTALLYSVSPAPDLFFPATAPTTYPFLGAPAVGSCEGNAFDQDHFLRVLDRAYTEEYVDGLRRVQDGGYEQFQAAAKVAERISLAVARLECCMRLSAATGGAFATGAVEFYRGEATDGAIELLPGSQVSTGDGRVFITTEAATFGGLDLGPVSVGVIALTWGYEYNVPGQVTTLGGETIPGEIDTIAQFVTSPEAFDRYMRVRQIAPTSGGRPACLDGLGEEVLILRQAGESDNAYRHRIRTTPDTISPNAILRAVDEILKQEDNSYSACFREVGTALLPGLFYDAASSADTSYDSAWAFAYDMTSVLDRFKVYLDLASFRGFFMLGLPVVAGTADGLVYDAELKAVGIYENAYDTIALDAADAEYDGVNITAQAMYASIYDTVSAKIAAGVGFELYIEDVGCF